jgi:hypothetical protein
MPVLARLDLLVPNGRVGGRAGWVEIASGGGMKTAACHPDRAHHSRGLCAKCYRRARVAGTLDNHERINGDVSAWLNAWVARIEGGDAPTTCVLWPGAVNSKGYGCVSIDGKSELVTRVLYARLIGEAMLDPAVVVMHGCDTPRCVNPLHLCRGSNDDNMNDMTRKGRQARGEGNGRAILSAADVQELRTLAEAGGTHRRVASLARQYGVSRRTLQAALTGETWAHLEPVVGIPG